jgi:hypothetical protein
VADVAARKFAEGTGVAADKTRLEIERVLTRYGAEQFMSGWKAGSSVLAFVVGGRQIRFILPLPAEEEFATRQAGARGTVVRTDAQRAEAHKSEINRRWRALALIIKAKLEAVESGIVTFEDEFLPHTVLPNGQTASEWMQPQVEQAYLSGAMPTALLLERPKA